MMGGSGRGFDFGAHFRASAAQAKASNVASRATNLEQRVERLLMITEALWEILKEQHGYTDEELIRRVGLIDLCDGRLDGREAPSGPREREQCGRMLSRKHVKCIYCGAPVVANPFDR